METTMVRSIIIGALLCAAVPQSNSAAARDSFNIAVVGPMSGNMAAFGNQMQAGGQVAMEWMARHYGNQKTSISVTLHDDQCDSQKAINVAQGLVDRVDAVIGHPCRFAAQAAGRIYERAGIPFLTVNSSKALLMDSSKGRFRICGRNDKQARLMFQHALNQFSRNEVGSLLFHENETTKATITIRGEKSSHVDLGSIMARIKNSDLKIVVTIGANRNDATQLVKRFSKNPAKVQFIFDEQPTMTPFGALKKIGFSLDNALFSSACYIPSSNDEWGVFSGAIQKNTLREIGFAAPTLAGISLLAAAVLETNKFDPNTLGKTLQTKTFKTPIAKIKFDGAGEMASGQSDQSIASGYIYGWYMDLDGKLMRCTRSNPWKP